MDFWYYVLRWIGGWCDIIDGICRVISLGFWSPTLSFKMVIYSAKRVCYKQMKKAGIPFPGEDEPQRSTNGR